MRFLLMLALLLGLAACEVGVMRFLLMLALLLGLAACESPEAQQTRLRAEKEADDRRAEAAKEEHEKREAASRAKIDSLKKLKILNVRVKDDSADFILEDGSVVTFRAMLRTIYRRNDCDKHEPYLRME